MIQTLIAVALTIAMGVSGAGAKSGVETFGKWQLRISGHSTGKKRAYLAYELARGSELRVYCREIDGYPTPPSTRISYFLSVRLVAPKQDSGPSIDVTYAIGPKGERVSDEWRRPMVREKPGSIEATRVDANEIISWMRHAAGRFELEALGQRLSASLGQFDSAMTALEPHCRRHE